MPKAMRETSSPLRPNVEVFILFLEIEDRQAGCLRCCSPGLPARQPVSSTPRITSMPRADCRHARASRSSARRRLALTRFSYSGSYGPKFFDQTLPIESLVN